MTAYSLLLRADARRGSDTVALSDRLRELIAALPFVEEDTYSATATRKKRGGAIQHHARISVLDRDDAAKAMKEIADVYRTNPNLVDRINEAKLLVTIDDSGIVGFATDDFRWDREFGGEA